MVDIWRVSPGAAPYHDFLWNYGPLSLLFNGLLFKCFGPGMMVLVTANLAVYGAIVLLAYLAFRAAWGRLAAFTALAVFISVFSFSILNGVGNYNYATPYHSKPLTASCSFWRRRLSWCDGAGKSRPLSFLLGLCGGVAAVLKPEFMLAGGILGIAGWLVRRRQGWRADAAETALILAGVALPTLGCAAWLARAESWRAALVDSCQAWWLVLVNQRNPGLVYRRFSRALIVPGAMPGWNCGPRSARSSSWGRMGGGWFVYRSWPRTLRWLPRWRRWRWPVPFRLTRTRAGACRG